MKIRSDIIRTYQSIHTWTGITTGLLLFICFFAGALTMFQGSIQRWADSSLQNRIGDWPTLETQQLDILVREVAARSQKVKSGFVLTLDGSAPAMSWSVGQAELGQTATRRYASIADNNLISLPADQDQLSRLIDELHRTAGIAGEVGHEHLGVYVMGVVAVVYFLALVSGLIFLLPTLTRSFFALRNKRGRFRYLLDTHNLVGISSLPFHIIIAFSVVVFAFHDQLYDGLRQVYDGKPLFERQAPDNRPYHINQLPRIQTYLDIAEQQFPGYQLNKIQFRGLNSRTPSAVMELTHDDRMLVNPAGDRLVIHPYTLALTYSTNPAGEEGIWGRIVSGFFALHFGSFGGEWGRWLYFLFGLSGAYLFYSGNLLWLEKRRQKKNYSARILNNMTALTVGVSFSCIAGIALAMICSRWFAGQTDNLNGVYVWAYYGVFFGGVIYAFVRGGAKAHAELQLFAGLACLLIPLTSLFAWILPVNLLTRSYTLESWLLEFMALIFAVVFLRSAAKNHRLNSKHKDEIAHSEQQSELSLS